MTRAEALAALAKVGKAMHTQFPDAPRLEHLDNHLATVAMVVAHIYDESNRAES